MMSNIKKYVREFSTVTVTSKCGYKTFAKLDRKGGYRWINVSPNGKLDDPSCEITEQDFVALLEIFSKAGMRVKFSCNSCF